MLPCQPRETPHRRFLLRLTGPRRRQLLQCVQSLASSLRPDQHLAVAVNVAVQPARQDHGCREGCPHEEVLHLHLLSFALLR